METAEYELGQAQNGNSWLDGWNELKEVARTATWETFEAKLSKEQQEIGAPDRKILCFLRSGRAEYGSTVSWRMDSGARKEKTQCLKNLER